MLSVGTNADCEPLQPFDNEQQEKMKSDYEYKITMLQSRVSILEDEIEDSRETLKVRSSS